MSDELGEGVGSDDKRGLSRRAALKAGVAVGVGAVAWSGASITSLGGTPAYAITVSGITKIDLNAGCRNTDQASNCPVGSLFRYHTLNAAALPPGFCLANNPGEGTCCGSATPPELRWDTKVTGTLRCEIVIDSYIGQTACKNLNTTLRNACGFTVSGVGTSCVNSVMPCNAAGIDPNTFYTIYALCTTSGVPPAPPPGGTGCNLVATQPCTNGPTC